MTHFARYFCVILGLSLFAAGQDLPKLHDKTSSSAPAPRETDTPTVQVEVKEVTLPVTVRDKKNKLVQDLSKDDFTLVQDSKPQTITNLRHETNLPLTFGLLVDTSMSMRNELDKEKSASHKFIDDMLTQAKDQGFVLHFDREVELLQDLTTSRDKLYNALGLLEASHTSQDTSSDDSGSGQRRHRGGTQLYDAIYLASNEILKKQEGRKAIVVITDGEDRGSKETLLDAVEAAQRAETIVYAIYMKGEEEHRGFGNGGRGGNGPRIGYPGGGGGYPGGGGGYPGGGGQRRGGEEREMKVDGKKILTELATKTGGAMFEAKKDNLESVYAQISEELRNQMILAYTPDKTSADVGYHRVTLTAKNKDLKVQTREGYYVPEPTTASK